jgi:CNT family concentrative nucleoside transporter
VLVVSALSALLFYWRVLPWIVKVFSLLLQKTVGVGGAIGLSSAANVFVGMVEAPLVVKPYIRNMSRGELFILMSCGMATVCRHRDGALREHPLEGGTRRTGAHSHRLYHQPPAAIAISVLMVPGEAATEGKLVPQAATASMDAVTRGTVDGVQLLVNIVAMLLVLVALVSLANQILALLPEVAGAPVTLQRVLGIALAPLVWIMGIPWAEATTAGALMGTKTVLNELLAYIDLAKLPEGALSPRSRLMMTYALCGFANFGSLGIMIGGLATLAPERRDEIVSLGGKTIVSGTLATYVAGSVVGILY